MNFGKRYAKERLVSAYIYSDYYLTFVKELHTMLLQATIIRNYFVKTQTSVASFSPPDLSIIFGCESSPISRNVRSFVRPLVS